MGREKNIGKVIPLEKVWLSKPELAAYLGVSERYIIQNINTNPKINVYRLSTKAYLYDRNNIDDFVRKSRT